MWEHAKCEALHLRFKVRIGQNTAPHVYSHNNASKAKHRPHRETAQRGAHTWSWSDTPGLTPPPHLSFPSMATQAPHAFYNLWSLHSKNTSTFKDVNIHTAFFKKKKHILFTQSMVWGFVIQSSIHELHSWTELQTLRQAVLFRQMCFW